METLILTRPAVEAGEKLGFLPGDLQDKVDPYLRPLYDALYDMVEYEKLQRLFQQRHRRGGPPGLHAGPHPQRRLHHPGRGPEHQPRTDEDVPDPHGHGSKMVVTGDVTQIDLPSAATSGLVEAKELLHGVEGIAFIHFSDRDVVRHPLVQDIIRAYDSRRARRASEAERSRER